MSWSDYYRRRDGLAAVLRQAGRDPGAPLPRHAAFASQDELLLALHHKWLLRLTGQLGLALAEAERDPRVDRVDAVGAAWRRAAAENPVLRTLLTRHAEEYADALRPAVETEQRLVALTAGLAEPHEPAEKIAQVGAAFLALLDAAPHGGDDRREPPGRRLLRGLLTSVRLRVSA